MPEPKALIFDLDGVLIDSEPLHLRTWVEALSQCGLQVAEDELEGLHGRASDEAILWLQEHLGQRAESFSSRELLEHKRARYIELMSTELRAVPGVDEFLRRHKGVLPLGLVTSAGLKFVGRSLKIFNWRNIFDALIGAEHVTRAKPHPEAYQKVAARFKIEPSECLVFEDSEVGIEAARTAGAMVCAVATSLKPKTLRRAGAHWVIRDFHDADTLKSALGGSRRGKVANWVHGLTH